MRQRLVAITTALAAVGGLVLVTSGDSSRPDIYWDGGAVDGCDGGRCCWRPVDAGDCFRINPNTGRLEDIGFETTMPANHAMGDSCVPTACSLPALGR